MRMRHLVNDDQVLYRFVKGLKPEVQRWVLMDTNVTVLNDAILLAERIQYADDFIKTGYKAG